MAKKKKLETVAEVLRDMGFRAEHTELAGGREGLRSATGGVTFDIVAGNETEKGVLRDVTFFTSFDLPGEVGDLASEWNQQKRFARVFHRDKNLVMEMDLVLPAQAAPAKSIVREGTDNWNRLLQDLVATLRAQLAQA